MAIEICFWEADGPLGETLHHAVRVKRVEEIPAIMHEFTTAMSQGSIVVVTKTRSDGQSHWEEELWCKPGYESATTGGAK